MNETNQKIASFCSLDVEILSEPTQEIRTHLSKMILGTPGRLEYHPFNISDKLFFMKNYRFLILKKSGRIIGTLCLIRRESASLSNEFSFWYIRYVFISAPLRLKTYKHKKKTGKDATVMNKIWKSVAKYFDQPEIMVKASRQKNKSLLYGYIPKGHIRSALFSNRIGLSPVRTFKTCFFSRLRPKKSNCIRQIREEEKEYVIKLLRNFYRDHIFYIEENLFFRENYYVYINDNEIVAGIQANPEVWEFLNKPGLNGFLLLKILPVIPFLSKYWKPRNFRFAAAEGIFFKDGHEDKLITLLESVCAIHNTNFVLYWIDPESKIYRIINKPEDKGFLSLFLPEVDVDLCIKFIGWQKQEIDNFITKPAYISCLDNT